MSLGKFPKAVEKFLEKMYPIYLNASSFIQSSLPDSSANG